MIMKNKIIKILSVISVVVIISICLFAFPASAASSEDLLVFSVTNWRGYVPYTYLGFFDDAAGSLDQLHYYRLDGGSSDYVLRFDIPKVAYKGDKFVFSGEIIVHESIKTFTPTCSVPSTLQLISSHFIDPETAEGFYKMNFVLSATIPADTVEFDAFISITSSPAQNGFYLRKVNYSLNGDPSFSINENADKNTSDIINNQDDNTDKIINGGSDSPNYEVPDSSAAQQQDELTQNIESSTSEGVDSANNLFSSFNGLLGGGSHIANGLMAVTAFMNELLGVPWLSGIVTFGLTLGIFSFLLGMGFFISGFARGVKSGEYSLNKEKRAAYRESQRAARSRRY